MTQKRFPIVADDEVMLTEMPVMNLYDESDFIGNGLQSLKKKSKRKPSLL